MFVIKYYTLKLIFVCLACFCFFSKCKFNNKVEIKHWASLSSSVVYDEAGRPIFYTKLIDSKKDTNFFEFVFHPWYQVKDEFGVVNSCLDLPFDRIIEHDGLLELTRSNSYKNDSDRRKLVIADFEMEPGDSLINAGDRYVLYCLNKGSTYFCDDTSSQVSFTQMARDTWYDFNLRDVNNPNLLWSYELSYDHGLMKSRMICTQGGRFEVINHIGDIDTLGCYVVPRRLGCESTIF